MFCRRRRRRRRRFVYNNNTRHVFINTEQLNKPKRRMR